MKHLPRQEERTKRKFDTISAIANAITFGLLIYTLDGFAHHEKMDFLFIQLIVLVVVGTYYVNSAKPLRYYPWTYYVSLFSDCLS